MSIRTDVELLSIEAMEEYASQNHLSGTEVMDLFHRYQIFEKMISQHEYLHQISLEEVIDYIDQIIKEDTHRLVLFHGTTKFFESVDLGKSYNRRDFGTGFYTTILESQAKEWAHRLSLREKCKHYFVYRYSFVESENLKIKRFDGLTVEWLDFIKNNRSLGGLQHEYDVVIGPVADDNTMETVQLFISGVLTDKEAIKRLEYNKVNNQVSFHTERAVEQLELLRRERYE